MSKRLMWTPAIDAEIKSRWERGDGPGQIAFALNIMQADQVFLACTIKYRAKIIGLTERPGMTKKKQFEAMFFKPHKRGGFSAKKGKI